MAAAPSTPRRRVGDSAIAAWGVAIGVGVLAFAFRTLSLADLANDHYMTLGWAQQVLFGAWPERDFAEPGMPLSYLPSALIQRFWPGPFSELVFTSALLAAAAAVTSVCAARLANSWSVGIFAAILELGFNPRLHSFHKLLTPAVALLLIDAYARQPSRNRLRWLGVWTAISFLFRHDLGVYVGGASVVALVFLHWPAVKEIGRAGVTYAAGAALLLVPYAVYVQWAVGWPEHVRRGVEFTKSETHQLFTGLPSITSVVRIDRDGSTAFLFFAAYALLLLLIAILILRRRAHTANERAVAAALATALALFLPIILREPIAGRLTDLGAVFSLSLAWVVGQAMAVARRRPRTSRWQWAPVSAAIAFSFGCAASVRALTDVPEQIDNTGIYAGWRGVRETWTDLKQRGTVWPWARSWPTGDLPRVIAYLDECTAPSDTLLLTWPAPEYYYFARRPFGAGHVFFLPPDAYTTPQDQEQMLSRLSQQDIPVLLVNDTRRNEFEEAYPSVAEYLNARYRPAGDFTIYDGSKVLVSLRADLRPTRTWGEERWPCGFR